MKRIYICPNIKVKEICHSPLMMPDSKDFQTEEEGNQNDKDGAGGNTAPGMNFGGNGNGSDMSKQGSLSFWFGDEY